MHGRAAVNRRMAAVSRSDVFVCQPTLAEIAYGIARLPHSKRKAWLLDSHSLIVSTLQRSEWTDEVSIAFGKTKAALEKRGDRIEDFDVAIAAHALAEGAVLVTMDRRHMPRVPGLTVEDWSDPDRG